MTEQSTEVDDNVLIKIYNNKISSLTNQNLLLEAKLHTLTQDFEEEKSDLLAKNAELQDKYDKLSSDLDEE